APAPVKVPARPAPTPPATAGNFNIEYVQVLELPGMPKLTLGGIAWSDHTQIAIINGRTITPGSAFGDIEVVAIERRRVKLRAGRQTVYLRMK
ncbi:MAG: hypothetical protein OER86_14645, partial [Phycisphaerae bacterium]|nr:hypothetical protein [Phycisphaerae bacterium]